MKHRLHTLWGTTTYSADKVEPIDLKLTDPISQLIILLEVHTSAHGSMTLPPTACLSKLELVEGSTPLWSLTGLQAEALDWYHNRGFRSNWNYCLSGGYAMRAIGINFGRYLGDRQYAFVPGNHKNPQLRFTLDIDGGGLTPTYNKVAVLAALFDEDVPAPAGFLSASQVAAKPLAASAHVYYDFPTDQVLRSMLLRVQKAGTEPNQLLSNLKLTENAGKRVSYDHDTESILRAIMAAYPPVEEDYYFSIGSSQRYLMAAPATRVTAYAAPWKETSETNAISLYDGDGGRLKTIGGQSESNSMVHVRGWLPHAAWLIPFGDPRLPEEWFDPRGKTDVKLDLTTASGAAATDTGEVVVEAVQPY